MGLHKQSPAARADALPPCGHGHGCELWAVSPRSPLRCCHVAQGRAHLVLRYPQPTCKASARHQGGHGSEKEQTLPRHVPATHQQRGAPYHTAGSQWLACAWSHTRAQAPVPANGSACCAQPAAAPAAACASRHAGCSGSEGLDMYESSSSPLELRLHLCRCGSLELVIQRLVLFVTLHINRHLQRKCLQPSNRHIPIILESQAFATEM